MVAKPIVKWAGGKSRLLGELLSRVPPEIGTYAEPFAGGAALFFAIASSPVHRFERALLSDANEELVATYRAVRDDVDALVAELGKYKHDEKLFYRTREMDTRGMSDVQRGARLLFLNRTCYNGLWRVNAAGRFNVPFGRYKNPKILHEPTLRAASTALASLLTSHRSGLQALVAPMEPSAADLITTPLVSRILDILREDFDYVVVDTPPALDDHVLAAFDHSNVVALLATLDIPALKNLKLTLETLDLIGYPRDRLKIVLNRSDSKVGLSLSEVEKTLRAPIVAQIPSSRDVPASTNRGVAIVSDDPKSPVSIAIRSFIDTYVTAQSTDEAIPPQMRTDRRATRRWRRNP